MFHNLFQHGELKVFCNQKQAIFSFFSCCPEMIFEKWPIANELELIFHVRYFHWTIFYFHPSQQHIVSMPVYFPH